MNSISCGKHSNDTFVPQLLLFLLLVAADNLFTASDMAGSIIA